MIIAGIALYNHLYIVSIIFVAISIVADLFDGSLARFQKKESDVGRMVDITTDTASFSVFLISLAFAHMLAFAFAIILIIMQIIVVNKNTKKALLNAHHTSAKIHTLHGFWVIPNAVKVIMYIGFIIGVTKNTDFIVLGGLLALVVLAFGIIKR